MRLTAEQINDIFPDLDTPIAPNDGRTHRWQRHLMFARCVLGEPWPVVFGIAHGFAHEPLSLDAMHRVAIGWADDPREVVA